MTESKVNRRLQAAMSLPVTAARLPIGMAPPESRPGVSAVWVIQGTNKTRLMCRTIDFVRCRCCSRSSELGGSNVHVANAYECKCRVQEFVNIQFWEQSQTRHLTLDTHLLPAMLSHIVTGHVPIHPNGMLPEQQQTCLSMILSAILSANRRSSNKALVMRCDTRQHFKQLCCQGVTY